MLLLALVLLALAPCSSLSPVTFRRAESLTGLFDRATVTEREIVNVLGRWKTHRDWDVAPELDAVPEDAPVLKWSERKKLDPARTPQRRRMLTKMGQVQRYLFVQNVQTLPFKEDKLARSVGASARELNAEPVSELAAEIVFDALSVSKSGIVPKDDCDARRASYVDADGAFDREAFSADVSQARFNILAFLAAYPGVPNLILLAVLYKKNALQGFEEYSADFTQKISEQWAPVTSGGAAAGLMGMLNEPLLQDVDGVLVPTPGNLLLIGAFGALFFAVRPLVLGEETVNR
tara:strand:- start:216 stop:1088 length:873 start_codon:yes stop_codon:yes gene_type:complete